jgi:hypothetical protein
VRIHTDSAAAEAAGSLNARAFAHGDHLAFDRGEFAPHTTAGDRLLAHELAHVIQQRERPNAPRLQLQERPERIKWVPGMRAKVRRDIDSGRVKVKAGLTVDVMTEGNLFGAVNYVRVRLPGVAVDSPWVEIDTAALEPLAEPQPQSVVQEGLPIEFSVSAVDPSAFGMATGIDPSALPEGVLVPLDEVPRTDPGLPWLGGAAPGLGPGMTQAPWPSFPVPPYSTGVQWTQTGFGHFSQFSNVPGEPVIGGYRSWAPIHGAQGLYGKLVGPWEAPVPGWYFNDWWFRMMSPESQTLVYRPGTPQYAELMGRAIMEGQYGQPYTLPNTVPGQCSNCITVPRTETYGALGGRPVIVTESGVYDITEMGRGSVNDPFTVEQAGRGATMREWLTNPTIETPSGQIETLATAKPTPRTVWNARGVFAVRAGGWILLVYGAYRTGDRLASAAGTPDFNRVLAQETGSWVGGLLGSALGAAAAGAVVCSPTGPGTFVCAAGAFAGALIVGTVASIGGALIGDKLVDAAEEAKEVLKTADEVFSPMIERSIFGDKPIGPLGYYPPRQYGQDKYEYEEERDRYMKQQRPW